MNRPPRRKLLRLPNFDYAEPRSYFVTVVVQDRLCVFGEVDQHDVRLSAAGEMVARQWRGLGVRFESMDVETFVVMPNHVHGLVSTGAMPSPPALGRIIGAFKSITAREYKAGVDRDRWRAMPRGLWRRGYHDHVVRDETDEARIVEYIQANPINWTMDPNNPASSRTVRDEYRHFSKAPMRP